MVCWFYSVSSDPATFQSVVRACIGRFRSFVMPSSMYSAELALFFMSSFSSLSMFFASSAPRRMFRGTELSFITWFSVSMISCISSVIFSFSSP